MKNVYRENKRKDWTGAWLVRLIESAHEMTAHQSAGTATL